MGKTRRLIISACVTIGTLLIACQDQGGRVEERQSVSSGQSMYYASAATYLVTIKSGGNVLTTLEVPIGVMLAVEDFASAYDSDGDRRQQFKGSLTIKLRDGRSVAPSESRVMMKIMQKAPFALPLEDVHVTVERLRAPAGVATPPNQAAAEGRGSSVASLPALPRL